MIQNLLIRSASGAVYVLVIMLACFSGELGILFLASFLSVAAIQEWQQILEPKRGKSSLPNLISVGLVLTVLWSRSGILNVAPSTRASFDLLMLVLIGILVVWQVFNAKTNKPMGLYHNFFGLFYVGFPMFLLLKTSFFYGIYEPWILASIFILIWTLDSFAYLTGVLFGKTPFFPRISPKKTWEGFAGGTVFTFAAASILGINFPIFPFWCWMGLALVIVISAAVGDLFESGIKRAFHIKDSGNFMPGHGGILDRIDSLLFALPMAYFYLKMLEKLYV